MADERCGSGRVVAAVALSLALGACSDPFSAAARPEIHAVEVVRVPAISPEGMVLSVVLSNEGSTKVEITGVRVDSDPGLDVEVLGLALDCNRGCIGSASADDPDVTRALATSVRPWPQVLDVGGRPWLHLRLRPSASGGEQALSAGCLKVRGLTFTARDGSRFVVGPPAHLDHLAGLEQDPSRRAPDYRPCAAA